ncbi:MAG: histidine--tRNA ligase [Trueperaceae bacterium]
MRLQAVKGTHDILPEQIPSWRSVRDAVAKTLERAGVHEISTPIFEHSEVFTKSVGESADLVVQKEMYTFEDRGGRSLTLRPEFTAGVLRSFIENGMHTRPTPVKLWSIGPVFRAENVQRGRFRQFHQVNCEILGLSGPLVDAESIALLYRSLEACGLVGLTVKLGSVGDPEDRAAYNDYLRGELEPRSADLSETSRTRLAVNPMRILDAKDERDQVLIENLKRPLDFLGEAAREHFEALQGYLRDWRIPFGIDPGIVRGLDYYRRTAFEIHHGGIGAQSALCGGGRYDGLIETLGGPATPGIGWAFGVERVLDAMTKNGVQLPSPAAPDLFLVPLDDEAVAEVARTAAGLRDRFHVEHAYVRRNVGKGLRDANRSGARFAGLRGTEERTAGIYRIKQLASGEQHDIQEGELGRLLAGELAAPLENR